MLEIVLIHPLFGLGLTVTAYLAAATLWVRFGRPAIGHPVLAATLLVIAVLVVSGLPYDVFYAQAAILHQALGGVIVLLAVPLCRQARLIRDAWVPLGMTLVVGSAVAISTALALPLAAGADSALLASAKICDGGCRGRDRAGPGWRDRDDCRHRHLHGHLRCGIWTVDPRRRRSP